MQRHMNENPGKKKGLQRRLRSNDQEGRKRYGGGWEGMESKREEIGHHSQMSERLET